MNRKLYIVLVLLLSFVLTGCTEDIFVEDTTAIELLNETDTANKTLVDEKDTSESSDVALGIKALVEIGNGLWYDSTTRIVYWWNGALGAGLIIGRSDTTPTPYYAPNGLPYKYNPDSCTFEEINFGEVEE